MRNQDVIQVGPDWTELTNADAVAVTFQVIHGRVAIRAGDATPPGPEDKGWIYSRFEGELALPLQALAAGGATRLWAKGPLGQGPAFVVVDHA